MLILFLWLKYCANVIFIKFSEKNVISGSAYFVKYIFLKRVIFMKFYLLIYTTDAENFIVRHI